MSSTFPRSVVTHIHLFKNAGTSVDGCLERNFGNRWGTIDSAPADGQLLSTDIVEFLQANPQLQAVSSHHLRPPLEPGPDIRFLPIVFLRHPLDRIASAYTFEHRQEGSTPSSAAALEHDLAGWIDWHNARGSVQCANFHCMMLTADRHQNGRRHEPANAERHRVSAKAFLSSLPAYGIVEQYERSWEVIERMIQPVYPDFRRVITQENTTARSATLSGRLDDVRSQLGDDRYAALESSNRADMELYAWAVEYLDVVAAGDHVPTAAPQPTEAAISADQAAAAAGARSQLDAKRHELRNQKDATHATLSHLRTEMKQATEDRDRLQAQLDRARQALTERQAALETKRQAAQEARQLADAAAAEYTDLQRRQKKALEESKANRTERRATSTQAQGAVKIATAERQRAAEEVRALKEKLQQVSGRRLDTKQATDNVRAKFGVTTDELRSLRDADG